MAGILDEVLEGIGGEKNEETPAKETPKEQTSETKKETKSEGKPMNVYHESFNEKYGKRKTS